MDTKELNANKNNKNNKSNVAGQAAMMAGAAAVGVAGTAVAAELTGDHDAEPVEEVQEEAAQDAQAETANDPAADAAASAAAAQAAAAAAQAAAAQANHGNHGGHGNQGGNEHTEQETVPPITEENSGQGNGNNGEGGSTGTTGEGGTTGTTGEGGSTGTTGSTGEGGTTGTTGTIGTTGTTGEGEGPAPVNPDDVADAIIAEEEIDPNDIDMADVVNFEEIGTVYNVDGSSYTAATFSDPDGNQLVMVDIDGDNTFDVIQDPETGAQLCDSEGNVISPNLTTDDAEIAIDDTTGYLASNDLDSNISGEDDASFMNDVIG